jgi:hypothetical protein
VNVGGNEKYIQDFCGKMGKIHLEHLTKGWEAKIKMEWREVDCDYERWINMVQNIIQW